VHLSVRRVALVLLVALLAVTAATLVARAVDIARAGFGSSHVLRDADLDPLAYFASTQALAGARRIIPPGSTYAIVVGSTPRTRRQLGGPKLAVVPASIRLAFQLWLLPSTYTPRVRAAEWVIAYDTSVGSLGVRHSRVVRLGPDAFAVEVASR
jgi:hypothetical protein